jgi:hypothetical protein
VENSSYQAQHIMQNIASESIHLSEIEASITKGQGGCRPPVFMHDKAIPLTVNDLRYMQQAGVNLTPLELKKGTQTDQPADNNDEQQEQENTGEENSDNQSNDEPQQAHEDKATILEDTQVVNDENNQDNTNDQDENANTNTTSQTTNNSYNLQLIQTSQTDPNSPYSKPINNYLRACLIQTLS